MYIVFITCFPVSAMLSGTRTVLQCKFMSPLFDFLLINPHSTHVIPHYCLHTHSSSLPLTPPPIALLPLPLTPTPLCCSASVTPPSFLVAPVLGSSLVMLQELAKGGRQGLSISIHCVQCAVCAPILFYPLSLL